MEQTNASVTRTPLDSVAVKRKSKSRSYRQSYRSCLGVASRLGLTPARRLTTNRKAPESHNITVNPEHLALLVKNEWQLAYVTPLHQFRHTQLRSYARHLSAFVVAEKQQGLAVEVSGLQNGFKASMTVVQGMSEADDDPETVLIQIHSKPLFSRPDDPQKLVWSGWLTCINGNPEYLHSLPKDFTCLPLFVYKGAENLSSLVKSWVQRTFDCCFGPLELSQTSLQWLAALWTNCHAESNIQHLRMLWTLPSAPPLQVTYAVDPHDVWELWGSVRKGSWGDGAGEARWIDLEEVASFMQSLKSHFYRHFKLDLSAGILNQVSTALGSARFNGRIKISNSAYVITTLTLLTECALLKMPI
ncbi:centromere protein L isoform X2 [Kryptolebias marmoratus]|uniref:centromere protein L isoform X2 n=1 Tax=Kryptolebias marmoratus TaxID=37003 RepID=UPI0007F8937A|nr:centromere protein L isoform X2 [Kryptolebias marmoratus]